MGQPEKAQPDLGLESMYDVKFDEMKYDEMKFDEMKLDEMKLDMKSDNKHLERPEHPSKFSKKEKSDIAKGLGLMTQIGVTAALCIFFGVLVGRFLDDWLNASPLFLFVFAILGCLAAFKAMIDIAKKF